MFAKCYFSNIESITQIHVENNRIMFPNNNEVLMFFSLCFYRFEWDKLLENVHCLIISVTKTDKQEAYILRWAIDSSLCPLRGQDCDEPMCNPSARFKAAGLQRLKINVKLSF